MGRSIPFVDAIQKIFGDVSSETWDKFYEYEFLETTGVLEIKLSLICAGCPKELDSGIIRDPDWSEVLNAMNTLGWSKAGGKWWCSQCIEEGKAEGGEK